MERQRKLSDFVRKFRAISPPLPLIGSLADPSGDRWLKTETGFAYSLEDLKFSFAEKDTEVHCYEECHQLSRYMYLFENKYSKSRLKKKDRNQQLTSWKVFDRGNFQEEVSIDQTNLPYIDKMNPEDRKTTLLFDSRFECGNLQEAFRVFGRNYNIPEIVREKQNLLSPTPVSQEYDLFCSYDSHTNGHTQWYFFRVKNPRNNCCFKVRFNIKNMVKSDSLYNYGMLPAVYSEKTHDQGKGVWIHKAIEACYYKNQNTYLRRSSTQNRHFYTLSFVYEFQEDEDVVNFAHCFPYSYTRLQEYFTSIDSCPVKSKNFRRHRLCTTLCGNICDVLTITNFETMPIELKKRPAIVLTARVHPGESNSSFIMEGVMDFLIGSSAEALSLRNTYLFKIIPMLNPDGVIHGNYRCSLAGVDLNRRWLNPSKDKHPTIFYAKSLMQKLKSTRKIFLYCDIHGHSRKKNMFLFGCIPYSSESILEANRIKIFPYLLESCSPAEEGGFFSFADGTFSVSQLKRSTGRVVVWKELHVLNSFTLESSFCSGGINSKMRLRRERELRRKHLFNESSSFHAVHQHYSAHDLYQSGLSFCHAIVKFTHIMTKRDDSNISSAVEEKDEDKFLSLASKIYTDDCSYSPPIELLEKITMAQYNDESNNSCDSDSDPSGDNMDEEELKNCALYQNFMVRGKSVSGAWNEKSVSVSPYLRNDPNKLKMRRNSSQGYKDNSTSQYFSRKKSSDMKHYIKNSIRNEDYQIAKSYDIGLHGEYTDRSAMQLEKKGTAETHVLQSFQENQSKKNSQIAALHKRIIKHNLIGKRGSKNRYCFSKNVSLDVDEIIEASRNKQRGQEFDHIQGQLSTPPENCNAISIEPKVQLEVLRTQDGLTNHSLIDRLKASRPHSQQK